MSVELRITTEGVCTCGTPYPTDDPFPPHDHRVVCDWGIVEHPEPRPDRNEVGHLMLTSTKYVRELLTNGPQERRTRRIDSAFRDGDRFFCRSAYQGSSWTWELFDAHWWDGKGNGLDWLIGRWPD